MSFWQSSLGEITGDETEAFAKTFVIVPDGTRALAKIEKFENVDINGNKFLQIDWFLVDGQFKGQRVQQKIKVFGNGAYDSDPEKTIFRALNMLKLIYNLFGVKPKHANPPTNQDLAVFINKVAGIVIRETEPNEKGRQYNWVSEVHSSTDFKCETGVRIEVKDKKDKSFDDANGVESAFSRNNARKQEAQEMDDDIPF